MYAYSKGGDGAPKENLRAPCSSVTLLGVKEIFSLSRGLNLEISRLPRRSSKFELERQEETIVKSSGEMLCPVR